MDKKKLSRAIREVEASIGKRKQVNAFFKAMDFNKVSNSDKFFKWPLSEAKKYSGASYERGDDIGSLIFFLNMAAQAWERIKKK